jgi:uncharacterized protein
MSIVFERSAQSKLLLWKNAADHPPLILNGARQVGKTYLMKWLGKNHFQNIAYFNFDENPELNQLFESTKDVNRILSNLTFVHGSKITADTLIVFDEIQACKAALGSLKYFNENLPELYIICAGSLLGIALGNGISFPVGKVTFTEIKPLSFFEYLAVANPTLHTYVSQINVIEPIPDIFFHSLLEQFRNYFVSGGLPKVAKSYLENNDIVLVENLLNDLLISYTNDFSKHAIGKDVQKIGYVWNSLPSQLARENKKFIYQLVKEGARAREYEDSLTWLINAGLVYRINRCKSPKLPLSGYDDLSAYKLYCFDVGVLRRLSKLDPSIFAENSNIFVEFKGAFTENYILQSIINQFDVTPRYWTSGNSAEVDLLIQYKNELIPVEIKSDMNIQSKSLSVYRKSFEPSLSIRYSLKNLELNNGILNIPLFLADSTLELIQLARREF